MKKVMIGILILIPIIILLVVAMVSTIVSAQAHIAVENIELKYKNSQDTIYELPLSLESVANKVVNIKDYLDVAVFPEKANNYTIEWKISGNVTYTDEEYYKKYKNYLDNPESSEKVAPAAAFVDENGNETSSNTSGKMVIGSYCTFTMQVVAENVSKTLSVKVVGYDVSRVDLRAQTGKNTLEVGSSVRLLPSYTPIDSIVNQTEWSSSNDSVATVDKNGIVTAVGQGSATITLGASVFSTGEKVYGSFDVTVTATGASVRYGNKIVTSRSSLTLTELGIDESATAIDGCEIVDGIVTVTKDVATLNVDGKVFVIEKCDADAIEIQNKKFYEHTDDNFLFIISNVMHFTTVESYERYRTIFENDEVEISVDEYPFGVCVEVENKSTTKNPEDVVKNWVNRIGLNINEAYRLSWDDKYLELCEEQGIERFNEVTFDRPMPSVKKRR